MEVHKLPKDSMGGYRCNHGVTFIKNIKGVLEDEYFEAAVDGMKGLLSDVANELTGVKANVAITRANVKKNVVRSSGACQLGNSNRNHDKQGRPGGGEPPERLPARLHRRQGGDGKGDHGQGGDRHY